MKNKSIVRVYVDGENFTISLKEAIMASNDSSLHRNVSWKNLAQSYVRDQSEQLDKVFYFTTSTTF